MSNVTRSSSSSSINSAAAQAAREAAAKRAAELAAERARKAAEAAKQKAEEAKAKLKDALANPKSNPKEVAKLRTAATELQAKAELAEKLAVQKEAAVPKAAVTTPAQPADAFMNASTALLPCVEPANASNEAKFVNAAAQSGNGAEALASALQKNPNDPAYTSQLLAETKDAVLASVREKAKTDPAGAAKELKQLVDAMPDAASKKALIEASRESITEMISTGALQNTPEQNQQMLRDLAAAGNQAGPEGMKALTDAVAQGWPTTGAQWQKRDLSLANPLALANFDNQLKNAGDSVPFTKSLIQSLDESGKTDVAQGLRDSAAMVNPNNTIDGAKSEFDAAKNNVDANNQRLQQQLQRIGPGMTEAQKQQYIKDFNAQPQVKADLEALQAASKNLGQVIQQVAASPQSSPETIRKAADAAKELAKSPVGAAAAKDACVTLMKRLASEPGLVPDAAKLNAELEDTIQAAAPNIYQQLLAETGGDPKAAAERFAQQLDFIEQDRNVFSNLEPLTKARDALKTGDLEALKEIGSDNKFSKTFKTLGVMLSVAKLAGGPSPDAQTFIKEVANAGKEGLELLAEVMKNDAKLIQNASKLQKAAMIERFTPGLALIANAISTNMDLIKFQNRNGNWGDLVSAIGNATATLGSALEVTGIGAAPGKLLQTIGAITAGLGGAASMILNEQNLNEEMRSLMAKQPELADVSERLLDRDVTRLANATGMSGEDVQRLLRANPEMFGNPTNFWRFVNIAEASRLKGGDVVALAEKVKAKPGLLADLGNEPPGVVRSLLKLRYGIDPGPA